MIRTDGFAVAYFGLAGMAQLLAELGWVLPAIACFLLWCGVLA